MLLRPATRCHPARKKRTGIIMFRIVKPPKLITLDPRDSLGARVEHDFVMPLQRLAEPREVEHDGAICHDRQPCMHAPTRDDGEGTIARTRSRAAPKLAASTSRPPTIKPAMMSRFMVLSFAITTRIGEVERSGLRLRQN